MYRNDTKLQQTFYQDGSAVHVKPGALVDETVHTAVVRVPGFCQVGEVPAPVVPDDLTPSQTNVASPDSVTSSVTVPAPVPVGPKPVVPPPPVVGA